jgi:hypothetical protein
MHEMGIARKDNANLQGPCFGKEAKAGSALNSAKTLESAVLAMKEFERYKETKKGRD